MGSWVWRERAGGTEDDDPLVRQETGGIGSGKKASAGWEACSLR